MFYWGCGNQIIVLQCQIEIRKMLLGGDSGKVKIEKPIKIEKPTNVRGRFYQNLNWRISFPK